MKAPVGRLVAGYVIEVIAVGVIAAVLAVGVSPVWGLIPVGVYLFVVGVNVGSGKGRR